MKEKDFEFVCPKTKGGLQWLDISALRELAPDSNKIDQACSGAYLSSNTGIAYPVIDGIHVFLESEAIAIEENRIFEVVQQIPADDPKERVRKWYDNFGWTKNKSGVYHNSAIWSFSTLNVSKRYEISSHLSLIERLGMGQFLLDAASGALPHPEQLAYSMYFKSHVCVDFSRTALLEAKEKLGDKGIYVLADICNLPFPDNFFDGIISAYTIQHIEQSSQSLAVRELYRVLQPGKTLLIVSSMPLNTLHRHWFIFVSRVLSKLNILLTNAERSKITHEETKYPPLYTRTRKLQWWKSMCKELNANYRCGCFRCYRPMEAERLFGHSPFGVSKIRALEILFARLLSPVSAYLLINVVKP